MKTYACILKYTALKTNLDKLKKSVIENIFSRNIWNIFIIYISNIYITVVSASLEFMDSDTMISEKKDVNDAVQSITAMRKTALLCQVTDPEEKRKIIGDTFMRVTNEV